MAQLVPEKLKKVAATLDQQDSSIVDMQRWLLVITGVLGLKVVLDVYRYFKRPVELPQSENRQTTRVPHDKVVTNPNYTDQYDNAAL